MIEKYTMYGYHVGFAACSTVFQTYRDNRRATMRGSVQGGSIRFLPIIKSLEHQF